MLPGRAATAHVAQTLLESLEAELAQALANNDLVVVCWEPGCTMHRLRHWRPDLWVSRPQEQRYHQYSHGICAGHYASYEREADEPLPRLGRPVASASAVAAT